MRQEKGNELLTNIGLKPILIRTINQLNARYEARIVGLMDYLGVDSLQCKVITVGYTEEEDNKSVNDPEIAEEFRILKTILNKAILGERLNDKERQFVDEHIKRLNVALENEY